MQQTVPISLLVDQAPHRLVDAGHCMEVNEFLIEGGLVDGKGTAVAQGL